MSELTSFIRIRVSAEDKAAFETEAKAAGLNVSAWARHHLKRVQPILPTGMDKPPIAVTQFPVLTEGMTVTGFYDDGTPFVGVLVSSSKPSDGGEAK